MSFNKRYLPALDVIKDLREKSESDEIFLKNLLGKSDTIMGPKDSVEYVNSMIEKTIKKEKDGLGG